MKMGKGGVSFALMHLWPASPEGTTQNSHGRKPMVGVFIDGSSFEKSRWAAKKSIPPIGRVG